MKRRSLRAILVATTALTVVSYVSATRVVAQQITQAGGNGGKSAEGAAGGQGLYSGGAGAMGTTNGNDAPHTSDGATDSVGASGPTGALGGLGSFAGGGTITVGAGGIAGGGSDGSGGGVSLLVTGTDATVLVNNSAVMGVVGGRGGDANGVMGAGGAGAGIVLVNKGDVTVTDLREVRGGDGGSVMVGGGFGGNGGAGIFLNAGGTITITDGLIYGGAGGVNWDAGGGGGNGAAAILSNGAVISNSVGTIRGGGGGFANGAGGTGGNGGNAVEIYGGSLSNGGTIIGGDGSAGAIAGSAGMGVWVRSGQQAAVSNSGTIQAGTGPDANHGAAGLQFDASDSSIINSGTISGSGVSNAVTITGNSNRLELQNGYSFGGNVVAAGTGNTLVLGGSNDATFDASKISALNGSGQYQGFAGFEKSGTSTWTLTGTLSGSTNWSLLDGTLSFSNVNAIGIFSSLNFTGGTLRFTGASAASLSNFTWGDHGGGFDVSDAAGTLIVSGSMSGTGGLTKLGAGALTLTGTSDYTGATSVNAGTLAAGVAGAFSSFSAYTVASGARLDLNGHDQTIGSLAGAGAVELAGTLTTGGDNTSTLFSGVISGNGGFTKTGTGTMTLSGTNRYTGATTVDGGTLVVNGSIASSSLTTVNTGAILTGSGAAGAVQVNTGGTFAPGSGTSGSSMTVASLAFQSGAFYAVNLNPTTSSFANVNGNASLGGATVNATFANGSYVDKRYTILNAGSINGTFNSEVTKTNLPSGFHTSLSYDATRAYLNLALDFTPPPPSGGGGGAPSFNGLNPNQSGAGNAIINYFNANGSIPMAFGALTPQGLTQVSGEIGGSAQSTSSQSSTQFMTIMSDPTAAGRGGASGGAGATGYADEAMAYAGKRSSNPRDAFASFTKAPVQPSFVSSWSTWAMGYGGSQTTDGNAATGTNTSSSNIYGVAVGADYRVSWDTVAGFALSGGGTNYSVVNGGTGRSDMFQLGAFVRHNIGATYLTASAAYGWQDVKTDRYVTVAGIDHLKAEFNTNSYSGRLEVGHRFLSPEFGGLGVSPYAAVQITAFELPAYAEQAVTGNNTFALAYGANTSTATRSELGLRTDKSYALDGAVLTLRGRAAWAHDFNPNSNVTATFQTLPGASFVVNGAALAPDAALTTASAEISWMNGWSVAGTFEGEFSNVTRSYAGKGVVRYNW